MKNKITVTKCKHIKLIFFLFLILYVNISNIYAQDKNKKKFGLKEITNEDVAKINSIKKFMVSSELLLKTSDINEKNYIDNSLLKFFPPIVDQISSSCGPASCVHYIYTYELNYLLDRSTENPDYCYSYMYIWNFLNEGKEKGTHAWDVFDMIKYVGVSPITCYNTSETTEWPNGSNKYKTAMQYGVEDYFYINNLEDGSIEKMKRYLIDHGNGSKYGGLIQFSAFADPLEPLDYNGSKNSESTCSHIIPLFGTDGMHSMTIVGFDDDVWWDYNNDNTKEEDEVGAFLCVNSWGEGWGSKGKFYVPYYAFTKLFPFNGGTGNGLFKQCYMVKPKVVTTNTALKAIIKHSSRNDIALNVGVLDDNMKVVAKKEIGVFRHQGGDLPMVGIEKNHNDILEIALNIEYLKEENGSYYFIDVINSDDTELIGSKGEGELLYCALLDYSEKPETVEKMGEIIQSELDGSIIAKGIVEKNNHVFKEGINSDIKYYIDKYRVLVNFFTKDKSFIKISVIDENNKKIDMIDEVKEKGISMESFSLGKGTYTLKIFSNNRINISKITIQ